MCALKQLCTFGRLNNFSRSLLNIEYVSRKLMSRYQFTQSHRSLTLKFLGITSGVIAGTVLIDRALSYAGCGRNQLNTVYAISSNDSNDNRRQWNFIADVVDKAAPAVVYIEIQGRHPFSGKILPVSNGSGFIVRPDGLILTNAHVVGNNRTVRVQLHDGRSFDGQVQAVDPVSDLATVRIPANNLPILPLGNSSNLRPGEWVVAMGSPFRLSNTVTAGIVSSVQRGSKELGLYSKDIDYIQTDANINFGNSGGPLVSLNGEAIGINTMKVTAGISFAIPSDYAQKFLDKAQTIEKRSESRGWLEVPVRRYIGITMLSLTPDMIAELKNRQMNFPDVDHGILVHRVVPHSPAHNAGILPGDIITQLNGNDVLSATDIYAAVEKADNLKVTIQRSGFPTPITITVSPEIVN